ncbi:hypothetical protein [Salipiger bermudensis]|uniref:hypothetical protein n=1 Tax=Salipiger bermudensis TaxID=344736 RepID=UPI003517D8B3
MASHKTPLFADEKTAAELFCMKPKEFRGLVEAGYLPGALQRGGVERWDVEELTRIWRGDAIEGGGFEW